MKTARRLLACLLGLCLSASAGHTFNGTSDYMSIPGNGTAVDLAGAGASMSIWFKISSLALSHVQPVSKGYATNNTQQYYIEVNNTTVGGFWYQSTSINHFITVTCSTALTANVWHHFASTWSSSTAGHPLLTGFAFAYLDGAQCGSVSTGSNAVMARQGGGSSIPNLCFGGFATTGIGGACTTINFPGQLGEVAIWSDELSPNQVKSLASGVPAWQIKAGPAQIGSLVGYWPLWGVVANEPDLSGNFGNATVHGTTLSNHPPMSAGR